RGRGGWGGVEGRDWGVAGVADAWWRGKTALEAMPIVWDEGAGGAQSSATIAGHLEAGLTGKDAYAFRKEGDALGAIQGAAKKIEAVYSTPFLAHATMGPMNCTVKLPADRAEAWVPSQNSEPSLAALSDPPGIPRDKDAA